MCYYVYMATEAIPTSIYDQPHMANFVGETTQELVNQGYSLEAALGHHANVYNVALHRNPHLKEAALTVQEDSVSPSKTFAGAVAMMQTARTEVLGLGHVDPDAWRDVVRNGLHK